MGGLAWWIGAIAMALLRAIAGFLLLYLALMLVIAALGAFFVDIILGIALNAMKAVDTMAEQMTGGGGLLAGTKIIPTPTPPSFSRLLSPRCMRGVGACARKAADLLLFN